MGTTHALGKQRVYPTRVSQYTSISVSKNVPLFGSAVHGQSTIESAIFLGFGTHWGVWPFFFQSTWSLCFAKCSSVTERNRMLDAFWSEWDTLAEERKSTLSKVLWSKVDENLCKTGKLLAFSPGPRLARKVGLTRIPLGTSLRRAGILISAIVGRFPPHVGQLVAKTQNQRTPLRRFKQRLCVWLHRDSGGNE